MAVCIRMKKMGRSHQNFFRICAMDKRAPRHGRPLEELGTYDPHVKDTDARALLKAERVDYWLSVGALPSEKVAVLIKKYGTNGSHLDAQKAALERLGSPKVVPDPGAPASVAKSKEEKAAETAAALAAAETPAEPEAAVVEATEEAAVAE